MRMGSQNKQIKWEWDRITGKKKKQNNLCNNIFIILTDAHLHYSEN